jgi:hypothetical protein
MTTDPMRQMFGRKQENKNMFSCNKKDGNGFKIGFKNGYTLSVRFGAGNYCENFNKENQSFLKSKDAEIAIIDPTGKLMQLNDKDTVLANQSAEDLVETLFKYFRMKNETH